MVIIFIHAGLMITAFLLFFSGFVIARYLKNKRWRLKAHKTFGICGASITMLGFFAAVFYLSLAGRPHLTVPHAYPGLIISVLAVIMPVTGLLQMQVRTAAAQLRAAHRPLGWIMLIMMAMNIISGMKTAGII